ncbi:MAG TPA: glycosyl hydrolase family 28-related protein, partial [Opitutus sp.]|nr:glycosyl hydrolase family 28-related protein [Opitutus sp.]
MNLFGRILLSCLACLAFLAPAGASSPPAVYTLGDDDRPSDEFTLVANGAPVPVLAHTALYDYAHFSADGAIRVTVTSPEPVRTWQISPLARQIPATADGRQLTFELPAAAYLIVKINDLKELALAVDPLERDVPAPAGNGIFNVTAAPYHADATGRTLVTAALQQAIDDAHAAGGGVVYFPPGTFLSASLQLRSHVSLYLAGGATLRSSGDPAQFRNYYHKDSLHMHGTWFVHTEPGSENIRIFGRGTIDGNARELRGQNRYLNNLVVPLQTSRFTLEGVVLRDSGLWGVIPTRSDQVVIRDTKHLNEVAAFFENDAVDIIECQDVLVSRTFAISEDDTYSTKTWNEETDIAVN